MHVAKRSPKDIGPATAAEIPNGKNEKEAVASANMTTRTNFNLSFTCDLELTVSARDPAAGKVLKAISGELAGLLKALRIQCPAKVELEVDPIGVLISY
jgi:hypothetical protein